MSFDINQNPQSNKELSKVVKVFLEELERKKIPSKEPALKISRTTGFLAFLYEKFRSAIEYQEEHLLRRWAIERILRRRMFFNSAPPDIAYNLVRELIWSHYLDTKDVTVETLERIEKVIGKYLEIVKIRKNAGQGAGRLSILFDWTISLASVEIENQLIDAQKIEVLLELTYSWFSPRVEIEWLTKEDREMLLFIAINRALFKSDKAILRYNLLKLYFPDWEKADERQIEEVANRFDILKKTIEGYIQNRLNDKLLNTIKKQVAPFIILQNFFESYPDKAQELIQNPIRLERVFKEIIETKYRQIKTKVERGMTRSVIYVFLTKMVIALVFELPYDLYFAPTINFRPLMINLFFPPLLMFVVGLLIKTPTENNTLLLLKKLKEIVYPDAAIKETDIIKIRKPRLSKLLRLIFPLFYLGTFVISFGLIYLVLSHLKFNMVSSGVFLFFLCVISIFGYRVSQSAHELSYEEAKEKVYGLFFDFFYLPILWAGRWLSMTFIRLNFVIFLLDFMIEAPLKTFIGIGEDWLNFIKEKKKELV